MKHYELLKLAPGTDPVQVQEKLMKGYRKLDDELDWFNHPVMFRACQAGDDYDLMVVVEIDEEERLQEYLDHEITRKYMDKIVEAVVARATFDHY
jgi:hypothetical protein